MKPNKSFSRKGAKTQSAAASLRLSFAPLRLCARKIFLPLLVVCAFVLLVPVARAQVAPKRVVVLYWDNKEFPGNAKFEESFKAQLQLDRRQDVEYFPEYLEASRFPEENTALTFRNYLQAKYAKRTVDVVVASADAPLNFLLQYRSELFSKSPIVFVASEPPKPEALAFAGGATGIHYKN